MIRLAYLFIGLLVLLYLRRKLAMPLPVALCFSVLVVPAWPMLLALAWRCGRSCMYDEQPGARVKIEAIP